MYVGVEQQQKSLEEWLVHIIMEISKIYIQEFVSVSIIGKKKCY
jgi:hypothetical protein